MVSPTFDNQYAKLPERFFAKVAPAQVPSPELIRLNVALAEELGLDVSWLQSAEGLAMLSGNRMPVGAEPLAQAYAGHQFGGWVPQLGDGRAILLGEVRKEDGSFRDLQLKGSGRTPFSRGGDGKSPLGPVLREYIVSEAMAALGVPTTRSLAAVATGESVHREEVLPGAILTRVASSHVRVGTFQYLYAREDEEGLAQLAKFVIDRHYPEARDSEAPYLALLERVIARQASLIAQWMQLGFIHGVMNTDNMTISGETIDYGPCAFVDEFDSDAVFSSIDRQGRYAWSNQPMIANWNLTRLAETLLPLISEHREKAVEMAEDRLREFEVMFKESYFGGFAKKLAVSVEAPEVEGFVEKTLGLLADSNLDFTNFFNDLTRFATEAEGMTRPKQLPNSPAWEEWYAEWQEMRERGEEAQNEMRLSNPVRIPRNHRIEEAIQAAMRGDYDPFHRLVEGLADPFTEREAFADLELSPAPNERVMATFCGT